MRPILSPDNIHPSIHSKIQDYQKPLVDEVRQAVQDNPILIIGMKGNNSVRKARLALTKAGLPFIYLEYGSYMSGWYKRLSLKMWTGFPTFPMIFIDQTLIGGYSDLVRWLAEEKP